MRIFSTIRYPQVFRPWAKGSASESTGTGFFIETPDGQRLILTNNHVVRWASQIYVQGYQSSDRHRVSVVASAVDFDLALLKLRSDDALADAPTLSFAQELPETRDTVSVYGYPTGGNEMSTTKGIVSRIEVAGYDENAVGLRVQVDAAVNPGNSGGPAMVGDEVVGVAFQADTDAENIGYLIPATEVRRFLDDALDGEYIGKPLLEMQYQTLENPALRRRLGLESNQTGVLITRENPGHPGMPSNSQLKADDVITHIGPHDIDNHGQTEIAPNLRGHFSYFIESTNREDQTVPLTVIRDGESIEVFEPSYLDNPNLVPFIGNAYPRYYIFGPMSFTQVTTMYYNTINESYRPVLGVYNSPLITRVIDRKAFPEEELVCVSSPFFPHPSIRNYDDPHLYVVEAVNGIKIRNLEHLVTVLNESEDEFLEFTYGGNLGERMTFDRLEMKESTEEILNDNGIRYQYSSDLRDLAEQYEQ
ncbi:S1C family serine protease [Algisphaera agarilytica]|uniref:S1-C subfamily serine protease n=1 Tax=Algisphaera agarilytica TaxID=1385975 RepID=A0A7X0LIX2_9BACT|nr:trypsin-like peptidase domain-containing protein [Algisphaera agarilytica]MBB6428700.1 S1-C subfamily serine protease [Algisphaera agarilytica]